MGNLWSNTNNDMNEENSSQQQYYYYPPKNGQLFFGSSFIMGNNKFDTTLPESYLFGDNSDLNYLGGKPNPFPYAAPFPNEPMQMLRALINIRKETVKLISPDNATTDNDNSENTSANYTIEFIFDSDVDCSITIYFLCKEDISTQGIKYIPKESSYRSETFHYKAGIGQLFQQSSSVFNPQNYNICDLNYNVLDEKGEFNISALYPVIIYCVADEGDEPRQSHSLIAIIEKVYDQIYSLKPLKQKIFVDGLTYLLQEIYGIENKADNNNKNNDNKNSINEQDDQDKSFECVICMSELRDTLILPCRHFCACYNCSESLRFQTNNCPICRVPFRALIRIKAVQRISSQNNDNNNNNNANLIVNNNNINNSSQPQQSMVSSDELLNEVMIDIPPGYEIIPLVEALNGRNRINDNKVTLTKKLSNSNNNDGNKSIQQKAISPALQDDTGSGESSSSSSSSTPENIIEKQALLMSASMKKNCLISVYKNQNENEERDLNNDNVTDTT